MNCCSISFTSYSDYLADKKYLGGLLILLPEKLNHEPNNEDKGQVKASLAELEQLLLHQQVPVSLNFLSFIMQPIQYYSILPSFLHLPTLLMYQFGL